MTYIVYIPDVARGEAAYTQRSFGTLKDLARWAMDAALESNTMNAAPAVEVAAVVEEIPRPMDIREMVDLRAVVLEPKIEEKDKEKDKEKEKEKDVSAGEWNVDTSTWFEEESAVSKLIEERNWKKFAAYVFNTLEKNAFTFSRESRDILTSADFYLFMRTAFNYLPALTEDLLPELVGVQWELLPAEFKSSIETCCADNIWYSDRKLQTWAVCNHPVAKNFFEIIKFFREGKRHNSWKSDTVFFQGMELHKAPTHQIGLALIKAWWSGDKTTDEIREFMIKLTALNFFVNGNRTTSVGSAEFLDQFFKHVMSLTLPAEFVAWAIKGITHRHCKRALQELDIVQARRAEGQRFIGLEEYKPREVSVTIAGVTLDGISTDFEYNPLFEGYGVADAGSSSSDGMLAAWNTDTSITMAPYSSRSDLKFWVDTKDQMIPF